MAHKEDEKDSGLPESPVYGSYPNPARKAYTRRGYVAPKLRNRRPADEDISSNQKASAAGEEKPQAREIG